MRRLLLRSTLLGLALVWAACSDSPVEPPAEVDTPPVSEGRIVAPPATDGASLQHALDAAASSGGVVIVRGTVHLQEPLVYASDRDLTIIGARGARIVGPNRPIAAPSRSNARVGEETVGDALQILGAPDLTIRNLDFQDQSGHGIYFELTDDARGTVEIDFKRVGFSGQGLAGMWVEDQAGGSEAAPDPIESDASIHLDFTGVTVRGTGFAEDDAQSCRALTEEDGCPWADFDGMRINEGGLGDVTFSFRRVEFTDNAGDGIEFDETGPGGAHGAVTASSFNGNGEQPQFTVDVEDGFDIDEAGPGGIHLEFRRVEVNDNIDEGTDLDEAGEGSVYFGARNLVATGNVDENVKITESEDDPEGAGDIVLDLVNVTADGSLEGRGARFEEFGEGGVKGRITRSTFSGNVEDDGLRIDEEAAGSIDVRLRRIAASGNDGQGLQMTENGLGDIIAAILASEFTGNGNTAVELEEEDEGGHRVVIFASILVGEGGEESLDVIEDGDGASTVTIRGGTVSPAPVSSGDVTFRPGT